MRDNYEPPTDPALRGAFRAPQPPPGPPRQPWSLRGSYPDDLPSQFDDEAGAARSKGLRRLSRLTWRATQLSAIAAVGIATLFSRTAQTHASTAAPPTPSAKPSSAPPSPSPSPTHHRRHHRRAAPAPSRTLAPPTSAPAPPPPPPSSAPPPTPAPTHTTSGGSGGG